MKSSKEKAAAYCCAYIPSPALAYRDSLPEEVVNSVTCSDPIERRSADSTRLAARSKIMAAPLQMC